MERERDRTDLALRESERTSGFLADTLGELSPKMSGKDVTLREVLDEATGRIATDFETEPRVAARLFATVGRTYLDLGEIEQGLEALRDAYELSKQPQAHGLLDHRLRYAHGYGHALNQVDRLQEAEPILEEALELLEAEGTEQELQASLLHELGVLHRKIGSFEESEDFQRRAHESALELFGPDDDLTLMSAEGLAILMSERGELAGAQPLFEDLVGRYERLYGAEDVRTIKARYNLGTLYAMRGASDKALEQDEAVLEARLRILGEDHVDTADSMVGVGQGYTNQRRFDEALPLLSKAHDVLFAHLGENHPRTMAARGSIAYLYNVSEEYALACDLYEELASAQGKAFGPSHTETLRTRVQHGLMLGKIEQYDAALIVLEEVIELCEKNLGPRHAVTVSSHTNRGKVLFRAGRFEKAIDAFETARDRARDSTSYGGTIATMELAELLLDGPEEVRDAQRALALAKEAQIDVTVDRRSYREPLARAHFAVGEVAEAVEIYETLPDLRPAMTAEERELWEQNLERYRAALTDARQ